MTITSDSVSLITRRRFHYGYVIVVATFCTNLFMWGSNYCFGIFFKPLLIEFGWSRAMTSGAFSLAVIMEGLGSILMGRLADRYGSRVILITCGMVFGLGFVLMSEVQNIWQLYLFYGIVVGIGLSGSFVGTMLAVAHWFSHQRGKVIAVVVSSLGVGAMIMAPVANRLILNAGWRTAFVIVGVGAMVLIVVSALFITTPPAASQTLSSENGNPQETSARTSSVSLREALQSLQLWLICGVILLWGFGKYTIMVHITPHAIDLGYHATQAANILAIIGGATFVTTIVLGISVDRFGSYRTFCASLMVMTASFVWLLLAESLWALYLFAVVFSFGYSCGPVLMPSLVVETFDLRALGTLLGIVNFCACIGCAVGPILTGHLFDLTGSYSLAFKALAVLALISVVLSLVLMQLHCSQRQTHRM